MGDCFRIQDCKANSLGDLTKCLVGAYEIVDESAAKEFGCYGELNRVERTQTVNHTICVDELLSFSEICGGHGYGAQYFSAQVAVESRSEESDVNGS